MTTHPPDSREAPPIRPAERADLLAVYRIEQAAFPQPWPFEAFERFLGSDGFLVAGTDPVVGYVVADTVPNHGSPLGHVKDLAVREDARRQGIARRLLDRALGVMQARGAASVKLEVREGNDAALSLYREFGFVHRRTIPRYYSNGDDAHVLLLAD